MKCRRNDAFLLDDTSVNSVIASVNCISPVRHQTIAWTNNGLLSSGALGTKYSEILIIIQCFFFVSRECFCNINCTMVTVLFRTCNETATSTVQSIMYIHNAPTYGGLPYQLKHHRSFIYRFNDVVCVHCIYYIYVYTYIVYPDSKVYGADMGPTWGRQDPGGPHVGHMNLPSG